MDREKQSGFDIRGELYEWASGLLNAMVFVVVLFAFVACMFSVSGESMTNTLHDGDRVFVSGLFYTPARGDIVMFSKPGLERYKEADSLFASPFVKRIIAVGGDVLDVDYAAGTVYVNGKATEEPYIREAMLKKGSVEFPVTVPEGYVFCMGDNRNNSVDSRYGDVGLIDERYLLGRLLFRIFPLSGFGGVD